MWQAGAAPGEMDIMGAFMAGAMDNADAPAPAPAPAAVQDGAIDLLGMLGGDASPTPAPAPQGAGTRYAICFGRVEY